MIDMNIKLNQLNLENCSFNELAEFMNKHKELESLNIHDICITYNKIDKENIEKLYQYSHLIEGKLKIKFTDAIDLKNENVQIDLINILFSKSRQNYDFIKLIENNIFLNHQCSYLNNDEIIVYIGKLQKIQDKLEDKNNLSFKNIQNCCLDFKYLNLDSFLMFLSFLKEKEYYLFDWTFDNLKCNIDDLNYKKISLIIETIIITRYRYQKKLSHSQSTILSYDSKFKRKYKKYLFLHNINQKTL